LAVLMYAKYAGTCRECRGAVGRGDLIVYAGRSGGARHRACCPTNGNYRWARGARRRETAATAERYEGRAGGTCEDAPACGCCGPQGDGDYYGVAAQEAAMERA
jgi:hypothetical protein